MVMIPNPAGSTGMRRGLGFNLGKSMPSDVEKRIVAIVQQVSKQPVEVGLGESLFDKGRWIPSPSRKW
jgi:hypothetical protein